MTDPTPELGPDRRCAGAAHRRAVSRSSRSSSCSSSRPAASSSPRGRRLEPRPWRRTSDAPPLPTLAAGAGLSTRSQPTPIAPRPPRAATSRCTRRRTPPPTPVATLAAKTEYTFAAQLPRVRPVPGLAARLPPDPSERRDRLDQVLRRRRSRSRSSTRSSVNLAELQAHAPAQRRRSSSRRPAAIGTDENPTPTGTFYFTDPLDLVDAIPVPPTACSRSVCPGTATR